MQKGERRGTPFLCDELPSAFVARMQARLGGEWESFLGALGSSPKTAIRLHPEKGLGLFPEADPVIWHPLGRILRERPSFEKEPFWHAGAYYVQEASGMSLRAFLPERRPLRIIDLSAAPGGKSTLILAELGWEGGLLIANDPEPRRRAALQENLERWGIPAYLLTGRHPQWWAKRYPGFFDVVVVDPPCSGEGLWRKHPKAVFQWSPANIARLQRFQRSLLFAAKELVAPGGVLIYSTCTYAPEENEENLSFVFSESEGWKSVAWNLGEKLEEIVPVCYGENGRGYYFYPHRGPGEGFFISAWQKEKVHSKKVLRTGIKVNLTKRVPFHTPPGMQIFSRQGTFYGLTEVALSLTPSGLEAEPWSAFPLWTHNRPTHAAALLSRFGWADHSERKITYEEFLAYIAGCSFTSKAPLEWVTYEGRGLGWLYKGKPSLPFAWRRFLRRS
ncbi:MAG: RsmB/NOP family class I SAM-dependent RNA methyltransferase [Bacteroidia bacterium]|nr:RsmB/NOP family class I SAM-dependent RNA methyltransferase [Bacteroidia bacterium]MDW8134316.1 RsmB/NOP family class I SAM-dependent RNA methyltransferase [Bacteroidia bacterium]